MNFTQKTKRAKNSPSNPVEAGRITGVFGVRGELKCDPTSAARGLFRSGETFTVKLPDGSERSVQLRSVRAQTGRLLIALDGIEKAEDARAFSGSRIFVGRDRLHLEAGEYLDQDLLGCEVFDSSGLRIGIVERVDHYPASAMLVTDGKLIPFIADFVREVDVSAGRVVVDVPDGLLD